MEKHLDYFNKNREFPFLNLMKQSLEKNYPPLRRLNKQEISELTLAGNEAEDWGLVQVPEDFSTRTIRNSSFSGHIIIWGFSSCKHEVLPGFFHGSGIYNSRVNNSVIGWNCLILDCDLVSEYYIMEECILFANGPIYSRDLPGVCGSEISLGNETGGREIILWPDMNFNEACQISLKTLSKNEQIEYDNAISSYFSSINYTKAVIGKKSRLTQNKMITNTVIGENACLEGVESVSESVILSCESMPVKMEKGVIVDTAVIQGGCHIDSQSIIDHSLMLEASGASRHGKISQSVIASNTHVAEGEVTASLVGPFVGFHHQALLISALWPEGKGNIAYGANIGSNHTGKAPDQEITPGEGCFFGLGSSIKFPANFTDSPYSLFATSLVTLPQKIDFPFSLIQSPVSPDPVIPPAFNEIKPGWVFRYNTYLIERAEKKYKSRNKSQSCSIEWRILRQDIVKKVITALDYLESPKEKSRFYLSQQLSGLGKNFLTEASRIEAIESYQFILGIYALMQYWDGLKTGKDIETFLEKNELMAKIFIRFSWDPHNINGILKFYLSYRRDFLDWIIESRNRDYLRGRKIFTDYDLSHSDIEKDTVIVEAKNEYQLLEKDILDYLGD